MKAVRLLEYGGQLVFYEVPTPTIARDEILVKIKSTAVNHLDLVEASGTCIRRWKMSSRPRANW
jgi:NADPH:quinone reductase-like Zn-dependent oxidoreductase